MSTLPRANGKPDREAARIVKQIRAYARRPASDDHDANIQHVRSVHHILDAAKDALPIALAIANSEGPGKVSYRDVDRELGIHKDTVGYRVAQGKALLAGEDAA
jgi:hypothetical protein